MPGVVSSSEFACFRIDRLFLIKIRNKTWWLFFAATTPSITDNVFQFYKHPITNPTVFHFELSSVMRKKNPPGLKLIVVKITLFSNK